MKANHEDGILSTASGKEARNRVLAWDTVAEKFLYHATHTQGYGISATITPTGDSAHPFWVGGSIETGSGDSDWRLLIYLFPYDGPSTTASNNKMYQIRPSSSPYSEINTH